MIVTVFPEDDRYMPQDFASFREAYDYAQTLDCDCKVEATTGEIV